MSANRQVLPSKIEHGFIEFLGREQSSTPWPHFELKYPGYRNIVSELDFFKNEITNYARVVSRRKSSFERLKFEEITTFRSLEDEYRTISGLYSSVRTSVETASHRYLSSSDLHRMIPLKFKSLKVDFLLDTRLG